MNSIAIARDKAHALKVLKTLLPKWAWPLLEQVK